MQSALIEVFQTDVYKKWFAGLRDRAAQKRVLIRIERVAQGNFGDAKKVGAGVLELRIDYGPGYRVYVTRRSTAVVLLLIGGDKATQSSDIKMAQRIVSELEE